MGETEDYSAELLRRANYKSPENTSESAGDLNRRILDRSLQDFSLLDELTGSRHHIGDLSQESQRENSS